MTGGYGAQPSRGPAKTAGYQRAGSALGAGFLPGGMKGPKPAGYGSQNGQGAKPNGYQPAAAVPNGYGARFNGYGAHAGPTNGQGTKGNGYGAQAGTANGQGTKGNGL
ncbi:uncharacterized protein LOC130371788 [Gadus chalcogrammus]|uniref:uncharacterized protein LOC130371788 n=1 Tax=Gadus chalcogrammus TaxID=1042646 RepID=UPI0024C4D41A|nr:uncharacterized protein LOC130371788 [Gadus chalcogrammus]